MKAKLLAGLSVALYFAASGRAQSTDEMARIAQSPYEIERFVEKTPAFEWEPLWKALHIQEEIVLPSCEERLDATRDCGSELITINEPAQVLLLLRHELSGFETYLRFFPENAANGTVHWRFAGHFEPYVKYFPPTHKVAIIGTEPYLQVTGQGNAGTCLNTEVEDWIDLTRMNFEPVFSYTVKGNRCGGHTPDRSIRGIVVSVKTQRKPSITVSYSVEFSVTLESGTELNLGSRTDKVVYVRNQGQNYQIENALSTLSAKQVERVYGNLDEDLTPEEYFRYDLVQLKEIATGPESPEKKCLGSFLRTSPASPEKSTLDRLLGRDPTKQPR